MMSSMREFLYGFSNQTLLQTNWKLSFSQQCYYLYCSVFIASSITFSPPFWNYLKSEIISERNYYLPWKYLKVKYNLKNNNNKKLCVSPKVIWISSSVNRTKKHLQLIETSLARFSVGNVKRKKKMRERMISLYIRNRKPTELRASISTQHPPEHETIPGRCWHRHLGWGGTLK